MATDSNILARKYHGQRSLVGCGPWGHKELDATEESSFSLSLPLTHTHTQIYTQQILLSQIKRSKCHFA